MRSPRRSRSRDSSSPCPGGPGAWRRLGRGAGQGRGVPPASRASTAPAHALDTFRPCKARLGGVHPASRGHVPPASLSPKHPERPASTRMDASCAGVVRRCGGRRSASRHGRHRPIGCPQRKGSAGTRPRERGLPPRARRQGKTSPGAALAGRGRAGPSTDPDSAKLRPIIDEVCRCGAIERGRPRRAGRGPHRAFRGDYRRGRAPCTPKYPLDCGWYSKAEGRGARRALAPGQSLLDTECRFRAAKPAGSAVGWTLGTSNHAHFSVPQRRNRPETGMVIAIRRSEISNAIALALAQPFPVSNPALWSAERPVGRRTGFGAAEGVCLRAGPRPAGRRTGCFAGSGRKGLAGPGASTGSGSAKQVRQSSLKRAGAERFNGVARIRAGRGPHRAFRPRPPARPHTTHQSTLSVEDGTRRRRAVDAGRLASPSPCRVLPGGAAGGPQGTERGSCRACLSGRPSPRRAAYRLLRGLRQKGPGGAGRVHRARLRQARPIIDEAAGAVRLNGVLPAGFRERAASRLSSRPPVRLRE